MTLRASPIERLSRRRGRIDTAPAEMDRPLLVVVVSKKADWVSPPTSHRNSILPAIVSNGCELRNTKWEKPGALLLSTRALSMPGPHHSFSVLKPIDTAPRSARMDDCPGRSCARDLSPKRSGMSSEYGPLAYHGNEKLLRFAGIAGDGMILVARGGKESFWAVRISGAITMRRMPRLTATP